MDRKQWWQSKTVWFNLAAAFLTLLEASLGVLRPVVGESGYGYLVFLIALGNLILRFTTTTGIVTRP
jgi:hypothetical protein